jgi:hypothetical protein
MYVRTSAHTRHMIPRRGLGLETPYDRGEYSSWLKNAGLVQDKPQPLSCIMGGINCNLTHAPLFTTNVPASSRPDLSDSPGQPSASAPRLISRPDFSRSPGRPFLFSPAPRPRQRPAWSRRVGGLGDIGAAPVGLGLDQYGRQTFTEMEAARIAALAVSGGVSPDAPRTYWGDPATTAPAQAPFGPVADPIHTTISVCPANATASQKCSTGVRTLDNTLTQTLITAQWNAKNSGGANVMDPSVFDQVARDWCAGMTGTNVPCTPADVQSITDKIKNQYAAFLGSGSRPDLSSSPGQPVLSRPDDLRRSPAQPPSPGQYVLNRPDFSVSPGQPVPLPPVLHTFPPAPGGGTPPPPAGNGGGGSTTSAVSDFFTKTFPIFGFDVPMWALIGGGVAVAGVAMNSSKGRR